MFSSPLDPGESSISGVNTAVQNVATMAAQDDEGMQYKWLALLIRLAATYSTMERSVEEALVTSIKTGLLSHDEEFRLSAVRLIQTISGPSDPGGEDLERKSVTVRIIRPLVNAALEDSVHGRLQEAALELCRTLRLRGERRIPYYYNHIDSFDVGFADEVDIHILGHLNDALHLGAAHDRLKFLQAINAEVEAQDVPPANKRPRYTLLWPQPGDGIRKLVPSCLGCLVQVAVRDPDGAIRLAAQTLLQTLSQDGEYPSLPAFVTLLSSSPIRSI